MDEQTDAHWLTVAQVAAQLQVNQETVRRWIRLGLLPVLNIGSEGKADYRIKPDDLDQFIAGRYGKKNES